MEIGKKTFAEFAKEQSKKNNFGIVVAGAGEPHEKWVEGITKILIEEKICKHEPVFERAYILNDNVLREEGRTDLVIFFTKEAKPVIGKLAIWRLMFGSCMWTDDFVANHAADYKSGKRFIQWPKEFIEEDENLLVEGD